MNKYALRQASPSKLTIAVGLALGAGATHAATFNVTSTADAGAGSLRQAIADANAAAGPHIIDMSSISGSTITLASDLSGIYEDVDITGADVTLDGAGSRCFYGYQASISMSDLTITGCSGTYYGGYLRGGGVYVYGGDLTITGSTITGNSADFGGGVNLAASAYLTITDSAISGNTAAVNAGGVFANGVTADLDNVSIQGNSATGLIGGAFIYADYAAAGETISVAGSTISDNTAATGGGIILATYTYEATSIDDVLTVENSTISGNTADAFPGLYILNQGFGGKYGDMVANINASTITGNQATVGAGAGVLVANGGAYYYDYTATANIDNSIISGNTAVVGSGDLESDAVVPPAPTSTALGALWQQIADNPANFQRTVNGVIAGKGNVPTLNNEQITELFAGKVASTSRGTTNGVS
ncbi:MAG: hypothetical protein AAGH65_03845, partial [Pseudomonadota bacterium]